MREILRELWHIITDIFTKELFKSGEHNISLLSIISLIAALILIVFFASLLKKFLKSVVLVKLRFDQTNKEAIAAIISYFISTIVFLIAVQASGFELGSLALIVGGLGVGIGFSLQDITKNFISGLTILFERHVKVGDFVEFDNLSGYVKGISLRSTIIHTREGGDVIVPNSSIVENRVLNWSYDNFIARLDIPVGVEYGSDLVLVTETLLKSAYMEPAVLFDPPSKVVFKGFGDSSLDFELWVWVNRIDQDHIIKSSLNFIIEYNLRQQGIVIPFPQQDLWLKNPEVLHPQSEQPVNQLDNHDLALAKSNIPPKVRPLALRDLLRQVTYFQNFSDLELRQLIEIGKRKRLRESEVLFREGDPGNAFYIILSGSVKVYVEKIDKHLTDLKTGDFFGELSLMLGIPRTATVEALEDTLLFLISSNSFKKFLQQHPELSEVIVQELSKHRKELTERQQELRRLGLVDANEYDRNPVIWVRKRLRNLFSLS